MTYYVRPGVKVDKTRSNERKVTLKMLTVESTGRYRCEVSTEAPSFATASNFVDMYVVGKSNISLIINNFRKQYSVYACYHTYTILK